MITHLFSFLFVLGSIHAYSPREEFIVLSSREEAGLFSVFNDVLAILKYYEHGHCQGIEVDFGTQGSYYDPKQGPNWWSYYCEPICYEKKANVIHVTDFAPFLIPWQPEYHSSRIEAYHLIHRHVHLKPSIQHKISLFQKRHFEEKHVIGVHYRGTDKISEAPPVSYSQITQEIQKALKRKATGKSIIFVATDEQNFITYLKSQFGDIVCYNEEAIRSTDNAPLHLSPKYDHVKCGEEAIILKTAVRPFSNDLKAHLQQL